MANQKWAAALLLLLVVTVVGCTKKGDDGQKESKNESVEPTQITNRVDVPATVRRNLGITFAKVERRHVASTIRVPGQFEVMPRARKEYHSTLSGRIELLVNQYDRIEPGRTIYRLDSPQWRSTQLELSQKTSDIRRASNRLQGIESRLDAVEGHRARLRDQEAAWADRVTELKNLIVAGSGAGSDLADARIQLLGTRTSLAKLVEELAGINQERIDLETQLANYQRSMPLLYADTLGAGAVGSVVDSDAIDLALKSASAVLGIAVAELRRNVGTSQDPVPYWRTIDLIEFKATGVGIVELLAVTDGAWVEASDLILSSFDPREIRFRGMGLQANLGRLRDGVPVTIIPPRGGRDGWSGSVEGRLKIGIDADPLERQVDLITNIDRQSLPRWARRGVAAEMEITLSQTSEPGLAIPKSAVIKDGLSKVLFRRDPKNPDKVIRLEADLGVTDGRWVVVQSGLTDGDEVVHHGIYELMLASGAGKQEGGHFHADGTYHEGDHE